MAPGLPGIALRYGITSPTIVGWLWVYFCLLSASVSVLFHFILNRYWLIVPCDRSFIWNEWTNLGENSSNLIACPCFSSYSVDTPYRQPLHHSLQSAFAPTTGALIGFRFLWMWTSTRCLKFLHLDVAGLSASAVGGGSVGDLFSECDRAAAIVQSRASYWYMNNSYDEIICSVATAWQYSGSVCAWSQHPGNSRETGRWRGIPCDMGSICSLWNLTPQSRH